MTIKPSEVKQIAELNEKMLHVQKKIYTHCKQEYERIKGAEPYTHGDLHNFSFEVQLQVYINNFELVAWSENIRCHFNENDEFSLQNRISPLFDDEDHNVSSAICKNVELNAQKHCWIMHRLYDDYFVDWSVIVMITDIHFDILTTLQYSKMIAISNNAKI